MVDTIDIDEPAQEMDSVDDVEKKIAEAVAPRRGRPPASVVAKQVKTVEVKINLPPQAGDIRMDGRVFSHGGAYKIREDQMPTINEIQFRAWSHYREVKGEKEPLESMRQRRQQSIRG